MKTKEYRQIIADEFIKSLEENPLGWQKEWVGISGVPINGASNRKYSGLNRLYLQYIMNEKGFDDPRFYTFKQVKDMGLRLKKGSKSTVVEFWSFYFPEEKRKVDYSEVKKLKEDGKEILPLARYYNVFNAVDIEGIEKYEQPKIGNAKMGETIKTIAQNMCLEILHDGGDRAYYSLMEDKVHLPPPEAFKSQRAYNATVLHEIAHASGAAHRLGRELKGGFNTPQYAREELVAEITSCFTQNELGFEMPKEHFENHKAYIGSWIKDIKEKPEALMEAIKAADKASDYIIKAAEMDYFKDIEEKLNVLNENADFVKEKNLWEGYKMSREEKNNTVYIKVNKAFVRSNIPSKKEEGVSYNMITMPKNAEIDGESIGGYSFFPMWVFEDVYNDNVVNVPWQADHEITLTKGEDKITVTPEEMKEALNNSYKKWKENQKESGSRKNLQSSKTKEKEKEEEME